jgi:hypothetical protein
VNVYDVIYAATRASIKRWRICRRIGSRIEDVSIGDFDGLTLHGPNAEHALANARAMGVAGNLVAIPEAS